MKIVKFDESHLDGLVNIENDTFSKPWSRTSFQSELGNPSSVFFVAIEKEEVLGCIIMNNALGEGFISKVMVNRENRGNGIGKALIGKILDYAKENNMVSLSLEVRESNNIAISLYSAFDFKSVGKRKKFYSSPTEDALIMTKELANENIRN